MGVVRAGTLGRPARGETAVSLRSPSAPFDSWNLCDVAWYQAEQGDPSVAGASQRQLGRKAVHTKA